MHLVMGTTLKLALWGRLLNHSTPMVVTITTRYRSWRYEILLHWLTAVLYSISIILAGADRVASCCRSVCMSVVLVNGVINKFILFIWRCLLEGFSLLIIYLTIVVARHDWTLLVNVLLTLSIHRRWAIYTIPQIIVMLLKMVYLLISWVGCANSLLPTPHVVCDDLAGVGIRLLDWALRLIWSGEKWLLLILVKNSIVNVGLIVLVHTRLRPSVLVLLKLVLLHVLLILANSVLHQLLYVLRRHFRGRLGANLEDLGLRLELGVWHLLDRSMDTTLRVNLRSWRDVHVVLACVVARALPWAYTSGVLGICMVLHRGSICYLAGMCLSWFLHSMGWVLSRLVWSIPSEIVSSLLIDLKITWAWHDHSTTTLSHTLTRWLMLHLSRHHLTSMRSTESMAVRTIVLTINMLLICNLRQNR